MKNSNITKTKSKKLVSADKTPGGKVGGTSKAPKKAIPKAKLGMSMTKKMGMGGMSTPQDVYNPSGEATQNNGPMVPSTGSKGDVSKPTGSTKNFKKGGKVATKKYLTGGPTGDDMSTMSGGPKKPKEPKEPKTYDQAKKTAKYGTAMMRKGGATKKK
jgi:hypothetical protein